MNDPPEHRPDAAHAPLRIAAVVVNYRTPALTVDCLASLAGQHAPGLRLRAVVVDNASGDGSPDAIERAIADHGWSAWARVVRSPANAGFSAGNNLGIRSEEADAYWLLNSDTLARPGALAELARALDIRPDAGLVGPRLEWPDGTPQESCFRFHRPLSELVRSARTAPVSRLLGRYVVALPVSDEPLEPEWASFACILVRRAVIDRVGPLDDGYFMYFEDVDYCRRARAAGFTVLHWPAARVVHLRGQSGDVKKATAERRRRPGFFYAARNRYYAKFHGRRAGVLAANLCWTAGRAIAWAREAVGHKQPHTCLHEARDIWTNWRDPLAPPQGAPP
jgi:GT2 family glycosyltransferase